MTTVLVTGVGAIIGYGVLRSLRASGRDVQLIGADIYADAVGQAWSDAFVQAPLTSSDGYAEWLGGVVRMHHVDLIVPGIEQDAQRHSDMREHFAHWGCKAVLNDPRLVGLSRDKWLMHQELEAVDDPCRIPSLVHGDYASLKRQLGIPFLLKPRRSYASKGLVLVTGKEIFDAHAERLGEHLLAQPIIGSADEEYTVGVFGDGQGHASASIALRRKLAADGSTAKAWTCEPNGLSEVIARLCAHFMPIGPTNFQFRRDGDGWKLLEINPRISSSTSVRAAFGYNESVMSLDFFLNHIIPSQPVIRQGFAGRFIEDYVIYDRDHF